VRATPPLSLIKVAAGRFSIARASQRISDFINRPR
jgi:hypothetical protein